MKIGNEFFGFLVYDNSKYSFHYNEGILTVLPGTEEEQCRQRRKAIDEFRNMNRIDNDNWLHKEVLRGSSHDGNNVIFYAKGGEKNTSGFLQFEIEILFVYQNEDELLDGLVLSGDEIDAFYDPNSVFDITYPDENIWSPQIGVKQTEKQSLCTYIYDGVTVSLFLEIIPMHHFWSNTPFSSNTRIVVEFSNAIKSEFAISIIHQIRLFFMFLCYRSNVIFNEIQVLTKQDEKYSATGSIRLLFEREKEPDVQKAKKRIIKYSNLSGDISGLMNSICNNEIFFEHLRNSIKSRNRIDVGRIILVYAAFEREYINIYGESKRSGLFYDSINNAIECLYALKSRLAGKQKKHIDEFVKLIQWDKLPFGDNIKKALSDCIDILEPFIRLRYANYERSKWLDEFSIRVNRKRTSIAHGKLDFKLEPIDFSDLSMIEKLLYAMRLKSMGIEKSSIQRGINDLFNSNAVV